MLLLYDQDITITKTMKRKIVGKPNLYIFLQKYVILFILDLGSHDFACEQLYPKFLFIQSTRPYIRLYVKAFPDYQCQTMFTFRLTKLHVVHDFLFSNYISSQRYDINYLLLSLNP